MKKIFVIFISIMMVAIFSIPAFADEPSINSTEKINLSKTEKEFNIEISIDNSNKYAGAEVGIQCGEDIKIKSLDYNINGSKAGPVYANGLTWFSFFSGKNDFSGNVTATISLEYTGENNTSVVIDNISVYTKNNVTIDTYKINNRKVIDIKKEGANNVIPPLEPPVDNTVDNDTTDNNNENINKDSKTEANVSSNNNSNKTNTKNNNSSNSNKGAITSNKSEEDNKSSQENSINTNDWESYELSQAKWINIIILIILIISITCNLILGYSYIKTKKKIEKLSSLDNIIKDDEMKNNTIDK